jgi:hypothetical protein
MVWRWHDSIHFASHYSYPFLTRDYCNLQGLVPAGGKERIDIVIYGALLGLSVVLGLFLSLWSYPVYGFRCLCLKLHRVLYERKGVSLAMVASLGERNWTGDEQGTGVACHM